MNPFLFRRIRGPVFLLCFAFTAILSQWHILSFARSWPLYLLVAGLLRLVEAVLPIGVTQAAYNPQVLGSMSLLRRPSLATAVAELAVGAIALLVTTDVLPFATFWHIYAVWWPLLLIALGVLLLVERVFDGASARGTNYRYGNAGIYAPRRRGSGGLVFLILLLAAVGLVSPRTPFIASDGWRWSPDWNWSFDGETHENDVSLEQPFAANGTLTVENAHGDLQIAPSADGKIHVNAHQTTHGAVRDMEHAFAATRPMLAVHGASATVTVPERSGVDVRLVLAVPEGVLCTIHNHHGDIAVSGLRRALEISQDHGDVALDSLGGAVHLVMDHGDVAARALGGDLTVEGHANDIAVSDVKGRTMLHGEFFGDTRLDGLGGPVEFHTNRTQLDAQHVSGAVSLDAEDLHIAGADHGLKLTTRSKDVEITNLSGDAQITDSNSDVSVSMKQPLGMLALENGTGNVTLSIPAGASFSVNGQTGKDDEIESDFALTQSSENGSKVLSGQVGQGGPHVEVKTRHGNLTLRRSTASTPDSTADGTPDKLDEHPGKPERPGKPSHVRHLESADEPPAPIVQ